MTSEARITPRAHPRPAPSTAATMPARRVIFLGGPFCGLVDLIPDKSFTRIVRRHGDKMHVHVSAERTVLVAGEGPAEVWRHDAIINSVKEL